MDEGEVACTGDGGGSACRGWRERTTRMVGAAAEVVKQTTEMGKGLGRSGSTMMVVGGSQEGTALGLALGVVSGHWVDARHMRETTAAALERLGS
jgi:hypothetical protein